MKNGVLGFLSAGAAAGAVTGIFGAGGGMVLLPLLTKWTDLEDGQCFAVSVSVMAPVCLTALAMNGTPLPLSDAFPYLLGGALGGTLAGILGKRVPTLWLHKILGGLILWGGLRYLCW